MTRFLYDRLRAEVAELRRRLSIVSLTGGGGGGAHASNHQDGGSDEIDVTGLSGVLADPQPPAAHAATHSDGGGDDVSVLDLAGYPGGGTTFLRDDGTFAATGGGGAHATSHQNGGGDEISVAGLSGQLADAQLVGVRKNSTGLTFTRQRLNFIEGANVTLTVADDGGNGEVDITIEAAGAGSPTGGSTIRQVTIVLDGGGADITTGQKFVYVTVPESGTITAWRILSPDTGDIVIDVLRGTFAAFPTLSTITGGSEPELSTADKDEATVSWAVTAGDILDAEVDSCSGITKAILTLTVEP